MRGKWAQGIEPRHFTWVIKDRVAVCERPGGYGASHRKVRRQEEIIWIRQRNFDFVMSLCTSNQNLQSYEEMGVPFHHVPFGGTGPLSLTRAMSSIRDHVQDGHTIVVHREQVGDLLLGLVASYLLWMGLVSTGPDAVTITERLFERELGQKARELVAMVDRCDPPEEVPTGAFLVGAGHDDDEPDGDTADSEAPEASDGPSAEDT